MQAINYICAFAQELVPRFEDAAEAGDAAVDGDDGELLQRELVPRVDL